MTVRVTVTYSCGGCSATATAPEQVIRSEFVSLSGQSHGIGRQLQEPPQIASLAPEGWVAFDPYTGCTYCKDCWAAIMSGSCASTASGGPPVIPSRQIDAEAADDDWEPLEVKYAAGRRVRFTHPDYGYPGEGEEASEILVFGAAYTIAWPDVGQSKTNLALVGIEGAFNSVLFDPIADEPETSPTEKES